MMQRIVTAAILFALLVPGFFVPALRFLPVVLGVAFGVVCVFELAGMFRPRGLHISRPVAGATVVALCTAAIFDHLDLAAFVIGLSGCSAFAWRMSRGEHGGSWADVAATVGTGAYIGLPVGYLLEMFLAGDDARRWLLFMLLVVWLTDSMAYFVGRSLGKRKLVPRLSPKKTVEGSIGGAVGSLLPVPIMKLLHPQTFASAGWIELALVCLVAGAFVQVGDLAESMIKRDADVKDSGTLLKGHGGVLDRLDSILFVTVPFALYLHLAHPEILA